MSADICEYYLEHSAMVALRCNGRKVVCEYEGGKRMGSGVIQSVRINKDKTDWEVTVSDGQGGAFWFPLSELLHIHVSNDGYVIGYSEAQVLLVVANWQKGGAK